MPEERTEKEEEEEEEKRQVCMYDFMKMDLIVAPFHGLVGVVSNPLSSSVFSSVAYLTRRRSNLSVAVTFMSSSPGEVPT